jgi:microcystin-dependent protein
MSEPFLAEVRIMGFNFAPRGWATCDGQILPINQNQALYSLLGTTYGGDGRTSFALPDLRGRVPIHEGSGYLLGSRGGEEGHTLVMNEMPSHDHKLQGSSDDAISSSPNDNVLSQATIPIYNNPENLTSLHSSAVATVGNGVPHENMMPFTVLNFVIALQGLFPSRN